MFKLVAIRTGKELNKFERLPIDLKKKKSKDNYDYLKSLSSDETFVLFRESSLNEDGSVLTIKKEKEGGANFYKLKNSCTNIEISAIVGKNGSGKSTLVEILYLAIYNLAVKAGILFDYYKAKITKPKNYLRCELYFLLEDKMSYKIKFNFDDENEECIIYEAKEKKQKYVYKDPSDKSLYKNLHNLFYAISVNYSIYGLNSRDIGLWINHLFHKNDSYQTPLVINPMRTEGNFDINNESYLTKYRLLSNLVLKYNNKKEEVEVVQGIKISELVFTLNENKIKNLEEDERFDEDGQRGTEERKIDDLIRESKFESIIDSVNISIERYKLVYLIIEEILGVPVNYKDSTSDIKYKNQMELYIIKKLYRIAFNYKEYWKYLDLKDDYERPVKFKSIFNPSVFKNYLQELKDNNSHVTLKLRQALNYLINNPLEDRYSKQAKYNTWLTLSTEYDSVTNFREPFNEFSERILTYGEKPINYLPPSLFDITINVSKQGVMEGFDMNKLSSGEQQLINSIQSTLYHLNNLESYFDSTKKDTIKYKNALIIFDEIELYFHPDYQRKIVDYFLKELDQLKFKQIKGIHIIYITHSPFILSDIPSSNILKLDEGKPNKNNQLTFGANIHNLLADNFFLKDGFMGEYAKMKINQTILWLNYRKLKKGKDTLEEQDLIELDKLEKEIVIDNKEYHLEIIELIGEPVLKMKLKEMYHDIFIEKEDIEKKKLLRLADKLGYNVSRKD